MNSLFKAITTAPDSLRDYDRAAGKLRHLLSGHHPDSIKVVCDTDQHFAPFAFDYACEFQTRLKLFPLHNHHAMLEYAGAALVFWDGEDNQTARFVDLVKSKQMNIRIVRYADGPAQ